MKEIGIQEIKDKDSIIKNPEFKPVDIIGKGFVHGNQIMQQIPSIMAGKVMADSYILKFPTGLQGALLQLKQGGCSTSVIGENGKILGTASLFSLQPQAVLLSAFSFFSVITGQFFLCRINRQLEEINKKLKEILDFLYNEKLCELQAEINFAKYAWENYRYIMQSESERTATIANLQKVRNIAYKDFLFFTQMLESKLKSVSVKKASGVKELYAEYYKIQENYQYSIELYCISSVMEILYAQNFDEAFLENIKGNIEDVLRKGSGFLHEEYGKISNIIDGCKGLDKGGKIEIENGCFIRGTKEFMLQDLRKEHKIKEKPYIQIIEEIRDNYNKPCEIAWCDNRLYKKEGAHCL